MSAASSAKMPTRNPAPPYSSFSSAGAVHPGFAQELAEQVLQNSNIDWWHEEPLPNRDCPSYLCTRRVDQQLFDRVVLFRESNATREE
jgi:hypothetical protein